MIKEAFLLAAGLGTRLRPLTDSIPKPLIKVAGKPLIQWNLEMLQHLGCKKVVVNAFYKKEVLKSFLNSLSLDGVKVHVSEESELLDTGGGLKQAFEYLEDEVFYTWNSDLIIDPSISSFESTGLLELKSIALEKSYSLVSLLIAPQKKEELGLYSELGFSKNNQLVKFLDVSYEAVVGQQALLTPFKYLGISVLRRGIERYFPEDKAKFSLTKDIFPGVLQDKASGGIKGSICNCYWNDVGTPERLLEASNYIESTLSLQKK